MTDPVEPDSARPDVDAAEPNPPRWNSEDDDHVHDEVETGCLCTASSRPPAVFSLLFLLAGIFALRRTDRRSTR